MQVVCAISIYYMDNSVLPETKTLVFSILSLSEDMKKFCTNCPGCTRASLQIFPASFLSLVCPYNKKKHYTVA